MIDESPFIRAMAKTLCDKGVDPLYKDDWDIVLTLICSTTWSMETIERNFGAVKMMATIWFANERRRRQKSCSKFS